MKTIEYYLLLRLYFHEVNSYQSFYVSISELALVLCCSSRNVKRLLKKMVEEKLIYWKPGGGRGKRSKLQFRRSLADLLPPLVQSLVHQGKYKEAVRWTKREGIPASVREQCYNYVLSQLSFPRLPLHELNRLEQHSSAPMVPTIVSTSTGRWFFVDRKHQL
ncbi:SgrR family transcriptional regulator [Thermoactinomyces mirandus]|uniref:SgrR family transcriptional regulator n=1 Tax=Thermoactinomyces mirandus TaxID=2756294 RepID=A0A7W1XRK9_9BACL|nr:SgrR family transcriptional regulator [Thermoactinomyces mirandus]MBA4602028.1 SgrR family transcriptional regulator [Thermoactinomyces mirandus]